jgi:hypothetical protein
VASAPRQRGGHRISFRILHVFEFRDRLVSRENVWLDSAAIGRSAELSR